MYKLVIADDELLSLEALCNTIDWETEGFTLAARFSDGKELAKYLEHNPVDLVFSDIKMPGLSGLEIARLCSERYPKTIVVLLSAYQKFEYAKEAIGYHVMNYITKPYRYNELIETLRKAKGILSQNAKEHFFISDDYRNEFQQIFSDAVCDMIPSVKVFQERLESIDIHISGEAQPCKILNIHLPRLEDYLSKTWKHEISRFYNAVSSLIPYETENTYSSVFRYTFDNIEVMVLAKQGGNEFESSANLLTQELKTNLKDILNIDAEITIAESFEHFEDILNLTKAATPVAHDITNNLIISKALDYIAEHYSENITLDNISGYVNLSSVYFCSFFKQHTGETFVAYLNHYRIRKAMELLRDDDIKISAICEMVGFKNQTYFYNLFRKYNGVSPLEYRKQESSE